MKTNRGLLSASVALLLAACQQAPGGRCEADADCTTGQHCSNGLCLSDIRQAPVGQSCYVDKDCVAWADCVQNQCLLSPGACGTTTDCQPWQACGAGHACETVPGGCANEADCAAWQDCNTSTWRCDAAPGFCADDSVCAAWQECGTDHRCAAAPGSCAADPDCETWQSCDVGAHACIAASGRCGVNGDCETWQYCDVAAHQCLDVGATCTGGGECQAWQRCDSGHCVNQAGRCAEDPQCDTSWQVCDASNTCVAAPNHCATSRDCAAWESCSLAHACGPAVPCSSGAECVAGDVCSTVCVAPDVLDGSSMYLFGTLSEGACFRDALAAVSSPTRVAVGFDCYASVDLGGWIGPDGSFYYRQSGVGDDTLRRFVPDPWEWDSASDSWRYPSSPLTNDEIVPTPPCATGPSFVVMQAVTGRFMYRCTNDPQYDWYRDDGSFVVRTYRVLAWSESDLKLADAGVPVLFDAAGAQIPIVGGPTPAFDVDVVAARAHADGFRFLMWNDTTHAADRWFVNALGQATHEGTYPTPPAELGIVFLHGLDAAGAAYGLGAKAVPYGNGSADVVVKCELPPGSCSIVYDEANAIEADYGATPPRTYVMIHASDLVTGP
jgi:hypothetical protein